MSDDFWGKGSEFFNAKYDGTCMGIDCYKRNVIEQGDGCVYYNDQLMHFRCARAVERAAS